MNGIEIPDSPSLVRNFAAMDVLTHITTDLLASLKANMSSQRPQIPALLSSILLLTLQLFSNHSANYPILESRSHLLATFLNHYPLLPTTETKTLTLKTLEFVCTGLSPPPPPSSNPPLLLAIALFHSILSPPPLSPAHAKVAATDATEVSKTILKLLEFDPSYINALIERDAIQRYLLPLLQPDRVQLDPTDDDESNSDTAFLTITLLKALLPSPLAAPLFHSLHIPTLLHPFISDSPLPTANLAISLLSLLTPANAVYILDAPPPPTLRARSLSSSPLSILTSSLLELTHTLMQSKNPLHPPRQPLLYTLLTHILTVGAGSHASFVENNGFETCLNSILRISTPAIITPATITESAKAEGDAPATSFFAPSSPALAILESIFTLLAAILTPASPSSLLYFDSNITYMALTQALLATNIFTHAPDAGLKLISSLILTPANVIYNVDAIKLLLAASSQSPEPALFIPLLNHLASHTDHSHTSSNLTHTLSTLYHHILSSPSHPLHPSFFLILTNLSSNYMTTHDFLSLLTSLASPILSAPNGTLNLPTIWSTNYPTQPASLTHHQHSHSSDFTSRLANLSSIAEASDNVPYLILGSVPPNVNTATHAANPPPTASYLHIPSLYHNANAITQHHNPLSSPPTPPTFPSPQGFAFSTWLSLPPFPPAPPDERESQNSTLPLLTLTSAHGAKDSFYFTFTYTHSPPSSSFFTIQSSSLPSPIILPLTLHPPSSWHHITLSYSPPKRLLSKKATVDLFINAHQVSATLPSFIHSASPPCSHIPLFTHTCAAPPVHDLPRPPPNLNRHPRRLHRPPPPLHAPPTELPLPALPPRPHPPHALLADGARHDLHLHRRSGLHSALHRRVPPPPVHALDPHCVPHSPAHPHTLHLLLPPSARPHEHELLPLPRSLSRGRHFRLQCALP